jgi:hypothetical protein
MAFWVGLCLQSPIIIIFRHCACVRTTEQSRIVEFTRMVFGKQSGMDWSKIWYELLFGEESNTFGEKSCIFGGISVLILLQGY